MTSASSSSSPSSPIPKSPREQLIEQVISKFCTLAETHELEKEMRQEGKDALKIAAYKLAYRKKYYDMSTDTIVVIPTVTKLLALMEIYEQAEQYYYDPEDEYPLKYIAALRDLAIAAGGARTEQDEQMEEMGMDIDNLDNDDIFSSGMDLEQLVLSMTAESKEDRDEPLAPVESAPPAKETTMTKRQKVIETELLAFIRKAEDEELGKEMRDEGIKALKIAANKLAYKKKCLDLKTDSFVAFPSIKKCLAGTTIYEEAEQHYYDPEDEFPLKYIAALKDIALSAGGAPTDDDEEMEKMYEDIDENDPLFDRDVDLKALFSPPPEPPKSRRTVLIETEIAAFVKRAEEQELGKEMREEGVTALKIAADKLAYKKKCLDMKNDKFVIFPSITKCLAGQHIYEEAEKYYYEPEDEYPLKYIAALRAIALAAPGGAPTEEDEEMERINEDIDSDDELFDSIQPADAEPYQSKRQIRIEKEIDVFVKKAEQEELGKEMRDEGIKALKIAANKFAYRKKYYNMSSDKFVLFPSVTKVLTGTDVYEEAEKHYYDPGDDYPLKYIAALREVAFAAGGGADEDDIVESMAQEAGSDDEGL